MRRLSRPGSVDLLFLAMLAGGVLLGGVQAQPPPITEPAGPLPAPGPGMSPPHPPPAVSPFGPESAGPSPAGPVHGGRPCRRGPFPRFGHKGRSLFHGGKP